MTDVKVPRLLRVHEVAKQTGLQKWRIYQLLKCGKGPAHMKIGKTIRISEIALAQWIDEQHAASATEEEE